MNAIGWYVAGVLTPFVLAVLLVGVLAARFAWERRQEDRAQRPPASLLERVARVRDESLEDDLSDEDRTHLAQWEAELKQPETEP